MNRGAAVLSNPNPLHTDSVPVTKPDVTAEIGRGLMKLLANEYGNHFREGRTVEEARKAMRDANPRLMRVPDDGLKTLKLQFKAYMSGSHPFDRKRGLHESPYDWWKKLEGEDDADVLAVGLELVFTLLIHRADYRFTYLGYFSQSFRCHSDFNCRRTGNVDCYMVE